jgi:MoaA/NifB/PqqE/SkfB family radical SAM enzyme
VFCGFEVNLRRLEFTLTTKCNSQCIHCQADASPSKNEVMNVKDAHNYLAEAATVANLKSFMVFGGEPMLFPERAIAIFEKAHQLGIPRIDMITNGVWGRDKEKAEKWAERLKAAGLNKVDMSVDAFHAEYTPIEYPQNAALALLKAGVEGIKWNVAVLESIDAENEYDKKTKQLLKKLEPIGLDANFVKIAPMGRAAQNLREYFQRTPLDGPCEGEPLIGNTLTDPDSICIEPSGSVDVCFHLSIGNAKEAPLSRIISEYDWRENPVIRTLVQEGPTALLKLPRVHGYRFQEKDYINKCHLCTEIRKVLNFS